MSELVGEHQKMKLRAEAYEKTQQELESKARCVYPFSIRRCTHGYRFPPVLIAAEYKHWKLAYVQ